MPEPGTILIAIGLALAAAGISKDDAVTAPAGTQPGHTSGGAPASPPELHSAFRSISGDHGDSFMHFGVVPWNPVRQPGAEVVYQGLLQYKYTENISGFPITYWIGCPRALIEFWNNRTGAFMGWTRSTDGGFFYYRHGLNADELDGYDLVAIFRGADWGDRTELIDPYVSGIWGIRPR